jgi:hypothetical protein
MKGRKVRRILTFLCKILITRFWEHSEWRQNDKRMDSLFMHILNTDNNEFFVSTAGLFLSKLTTGGNVYTFVQQQGVYFGMVSLISKNMSHIDRKLAVTHQRRRKHGLMMIVLVLSEFRYLSYFCCFCGPWSGNEILPLSWFTPRRSLQEKILINCTLLVVTAETFLSILYNCHTNAD